MNVEQIMSRPVITCRASDTLNSAAGLMWENDLGALPVVDDDGAIAGMVTDRDVCMATYTSGKSISTICVRDAMSTNAISCMPSDTLGDAELKMAEAQIHRLPIVDSRKRPIGMVSIYDIARATAGLGKRQAIETLGTLTAICAPRQAGTLQKVKTEKRVAPNGASGAALPASH